MSSSSAPPLLSVTVPTYERARLLARCLDSTVPSTTSTADAVEVVVSDNSRSDDVERLVERFAAVASVPVTYHRNPPGTGAVRNFNLCVERARGRYNLMLHDDDYLLPGGIDAIVQRLRTAARDSDEVLLFGTVDVDLDGHVRGRRRARVDRRLDPPTALRRVLGHSSFVRVPGLVVGSDAYREVGGFRPETHTTCDFDMAVRLFARYGLRRVPQLTAAYTVHAGSVTSSVFTQETVARDLAIFDGARQLHVLDDVTIDRLQRRWFHQFVLAGTWRALRTRDREEARERLDLLQVDELRRLGPSMVWAPVRAALTAATRVPVRPDRRDARPSGPDGRRASLREW